MQTINVNGCVYEIGEHGAAVLTECVQGGPVVALPTAVDGHPLTGIDHDAFDHAGPITAFQAEAGHPAFSCRDGVLFDRSGDACSGTRPAARPTPMPCRPARERSESARLQARPR